LRFSGFTSENDTKANRLSFQFGTCHHLSELKPRKINQRMKSKMTFSMRTFLPFVCVLLCDPKAASSAINSDGFSLVNKNQKPYEAVPYVEYFKDHEISEKQARENLRGMQERDFQTPAHCKKCSNEHMRYCHSENLLKDHCCCNQSHQKGEFVNLHEAYRLPRKGPSIARNRFRCRALRFILLHSSWRSLQRTLKLDKFFLRTEEVAIAVC
jgi:hypothetical protein